ncbi:MAG: response regulator [Bdellovibrionales bacterium]|jgi:two-component system chemotaxis response regulator CheY|nr:response regulator [Bdellovibrionales bacterium]
MKLKLVIVDDAPFIREIIRNIFLKTDINVVGEASDGAEAFDIVSSTKPDVVLMDIVMPIMSGIDATRKILNQFPQIKVIACTTIDQEEMILKALDAGCCNFVSKPFTAQTLINSVYEVNDKKEKA